MSLIKIANRIKKLALVSLLPKNIKLKQFGWNKHNEANMWADQMRKRGYSIFAEDSASDTLTLIAAENKDIARKELIKAYSAYGISNLQPKLVNYK